MSRVTEQLQDGLDGSLNRRNWGDLVYNVGTYGIFPGPDVTVKLQALIDLAIANGRKLISFPHGQYRVTSLTNVDKVILIGDNSSFIGGYTGKIEQFGGYTADIANLTTMVAGNTASINTLNSNVSANTQSISTMKPAVDANTAALASFDGSKIRDNTITGAKIKKTADGDKIGLAELKQEVLQAMAGSTPVTSVPTDASVTAAKIAPGAVTALKLGLSDIPVLLPEENIIVDPLREKVTFPSFLILERGSSWASVKASNYGLQAFELSMPRSYDANYFYFDYQAYKANTNPIKLAGGAELPAYYPKDLELGVSLLGKFSSKYSSAVINGKPLLTFQGKIKVDRTNNKVILPRIFMLQVGYSWVEIKPADFNLTAWEFTLPTSLDLRTVVFSVNSYRNEMKKTDSTTRVSPFTLTTGAEYPIMKYMDEVIFSAVNGYISSFYEVEDTEANVFTEMVHKLLVAPQMFMVKGDTLPIYKSSIITSGGNLDFFKMAVCHNDVKYPSKQVRKYVYEDIELDPDKLPATFQIRTKPYNTPEKIYKATVTKVVKDPTSIANKSPKVLMIGDSLTELSMPDFVRTRMGEFGLTPTMTGSKPNSNGTYSEGRGSWTFRNYIGQDNVVASQTITRSTSGESTWIQNPFLKLADATDKANRPTWCFRFSGKESELSYAEDTDKTGDFYIFDFAWYLSSHGLPTPDVVTIALGTNDITEYAQSKATAGARLAMDIMIRQIKAANANIKIGVAFPVWGTLPQGNTYWGAQVQNMIESCMTDMLALQSTFSGVHIVPLWQHMSRDHCWPEVTNTALSATNQTRVTTFSDYVHYSAEGKQEYANAMTSFLVNML
ncbi:SGNH/GDSL hydrolase family protein [Paenibacillus chitinolyticus]|uniref:SGNH/GDSL hydrolase family protein n=1 Tax=Paenibacillus chitinolyticus TaxID=79263 RepID=UPI00366BDB6F